MPDPDSDPLDFDIPADAPAPDFLSAQDDELSPLSSGRGALDRLPALQQRALAWIRENQTAAMVAGFALGVFAGALMRD